MMEDILKNIVDIETWYQKAPKPDSFEDEDLLMTFFVEEVMARALYLVRVSMSLAPNNDAANRGYTKHSAVILGHFVRLMKLYDGFCTHIAKRELELAEIFIRLIYETEIRMKYLLSCGHQKKAIRSFILTSYKAEYQSIKDLKEKKSQRQLIPIEKRMLSSMLRDIKEDGISFRELDANRNWKTDGKDIAAMLRHLGQEWQYPYGFGGASRYVHGNWMEMKRRHLRRDGRYYLPKPYFSDPVPQIAVPITFAVLTTSLDFLLWSKADPDGIVSNLIKKLAKYIKEIDQHHERHFIQKG